MMEWISTFIDKLTSGDWQAAVVLLVMISLAKGRAILDFFDHLRDRKIRSVSTLLALDGLSDESKYVLKQTIDQIAFLRATGISTDATGRKKIVDVLKASEGRVSVLGLRRVSSYVRHVDGDVSLPLSKVDIAELIWNIVTLIFVLLLLFSLSQSLFEQEEFTSSSLVGWGGVFVFVMLLGLLPVKTVIEFVLAIRAKKAFDQYEKNLSTKERK